METRAETARVQANRAQAVKPSMPPEPANLSAGGRYHKGMNSKETSEEQRHKLAGSLSAQASKKGDPKICYSLAVLIINGLYDKGANGKKLPEGKRYEVAGDLYSQAAKGGLAETYYNLAVLIQRGQYSKDLDEI